MQIVESIIVVLTLAIYLFLLSYCSAMAERNGKANTVKPAGALQPLDENKEILKYQLQHVVTFGEMCAESLEADDKMAKMVKLTKRTNSINNLKSAMHEGEAKKRVDALSKCLEDIFQAIKNEQPNLEEYITAFEKALEAVRELVRAA